MGIEPVKAFALETLLAAAEAETGLSNWGDDDFRIPLSVLIDSINAEATFSPEGRRAMESRLHILLKNRLKLADYRRRFPAIAQEEIRRPIIITGQPRSGTSFLLDVLAQDPANRTVRTWEIFQPTPPPEAATYDTDPRIELVQAMLDAQGFTSPETMAAHPFDARLPEECVFIMEHSFITSNFGAYVPVPRYSRWLFEEADWSAAYRYHRQFLQHLQFGIRRERWALKAPSHLGQLPEVFHEYPDAIIVQTHRDLNKVLPSVSSFAMALRRQFCGPQTVDPREVGRMVMYQVGLRTRQVMETRDKLGRDDQFFDVLYTDLRRDPLGVVERLYDRMSLPLTPEAREAIHRFASSAGKSRHGHGDHTYAMSDYEFTATEVEALFNAYIRRYNVVPE